MRSEIEKRLHRVKVNFILNDDIKCTQSLICDKAENCSRCNEYYLKCSEFGKFSS